VLARRTCSPLLASAPTDSRGEDRHEEQEDVLRPGADRESSRWRDRESPSRGWSFPWTRWPWTHVGRQAETFSDACRL